MSDLSSLFLTVLSGAKGIICQQKKQAMIFRQSPGSKPLGIERGKITEDGCKGFIQDLINP